MGLLQSANELAELTGEEKIKFEDPRSVKQMLIDKGEWTEEDEIQEPFDYQTEEEAEKYFWENEAKNNEDYSGLDRFMQSVSIAETND